MNKIFSLIIILLLSNGLYAQYQTTPNPAKNSFTNPIFAGDYPDPSIIRDGEDFYMVNSSFEYYPGLLIWHSKDLINWTPVSNALHTYVGSVWAPDLVKYGDRYYIYLPVEGTNLVVYADDITGPWSEPVDLKVGNIDPGHVVDEDGNRYLYFSSGGYVPLSKDGLSVTGDFQHVYDGWPIPRDWTIECFCMEGPKLVKKGEYYYMTTAEGGTAGPATSHMVIAARSRSPFGPWENSPYNPIIRTKDASERWWSVGHGTIVDDPEGNWWMVFHGYEKDHYNMGRQTLLAPVEWTDDGWYKIPDSFDLEKPVAKEFQESPVTPFSLSDDFEGEELRPHWKFFKEYDTDRFEVQNGMLSIKGKGNWIPESAPLLTVPSHHSYMADVELEIEGDAMAGLVLFYNDRAFSGMLADTNNILANLRGWQFVTEPEVIDRKVFLRLKNINNTVDMFYSIDGEEWLKIENSLEVSGYHHNILSGFMSLRIGLVSMGEGTVHFKNFTYSPISD